MLLHGGFGNRDHWVLQLPALVGTLDHDPPAVRGSHHHGHREPNECLRETKMRVMNLRSWKLDALLIMSALHLATGDARAQPSTTVLLPSTTPTTTTTAQPPVTHAKAESRVYDIRLSVDIPVIVLGATGGLLRTYLGTGCGERWNRTCAWRLSLSV